VRRVLNSYDVFGGPHTFNSVWALGRYRTQNPQIMAAFIAALDRAMAMIKDDSDGMAALWIEDQRSRLLREDVVGIVRDRENVRTTALMTIIAVVDFMHCTNGSHAKPESGQDVDAEDFGGLFAAPDRLEGSAIAETRKTLGGLNLPAPLPSASGVKG
jgi:NitT/TauT family transport system substrate-binding protein